jgi:alkylation response protein AidB-like acyl-CoA dehydrogenase
MDGLDITLNMNMVVHRCHIYWPMLLNHIIESANNHIPGYLGLTSGAAHLITNFGSDDLKQKFVPKMLSGHWGGTMALTEPQAGSSLSDIVTFRYPRSRKECLRSKDKRFLSQVETMKQ